MRQPRFRIWDNERNAYRLSINSVHCIKYNDGIMTIGLHPYIKATAGESRFKLEESTGCFDINNVEIFEGDLVCLKYHGCHPHEELHNVMEIIYDCGSFKVKPIKLMPPANPAVGIGGGNTIFSHVTLIDGFDEHDNVVYKYVMPPAIPLCNISNIIKVIGNINALKLS